MVKFGYRTSYMLWSNALMKRDGLANERWREKLGCFGWWNILDAIYGYFFLSRIVTLMPRRMHQLFAYILQVAPLDQNCSEDR
jgi:hypothetical protein